MQGFGFSPHQGCGRIGARRRRLDFYQLRYEKGFPLFQTTFLGTSASAPSFHRGLSAHIVQHDEHRFLIDCGEGTQRQILKSGLGFKRLNRILITHGHLDHILGLARWETMDDIEIVGGTQALERIEDLLFKVVFRGVRPQIDIRLRAIEAGIVFDEKDFTITAFPVVHRGPGCFGYLFEEKSRRPFLPEQAKALEIPHGPWRKDLVEGKAVRLPDGREISPDQVLGPVRVGTRFAHIGDTGRTDNFFDIVRNVDAMVIESTYLHEDADMAKKFGHLTAYQAAAFAKEAGVGHLLVTHISRRYRERDILKEIRGVYPHTNVARDFDSYQIRRGECTRVND